MPIYKQAFTSEVNIHTTQLKAVSLTSLYRNHIFMSFKRGTRHLGHKHTSTRTLAQKVANYTIIKQWSASIASMVITDQSNYTIGRFS